VRKQAWFDWGVPAGVAALMALEVVAVGLPHAAGVIAIQTLAAVALVPRRRWPLLTGLAAGWLISVPPFLGAEMADLAAPILLIAVLCYSLARWRSDLRGLLVVAAILFGITGDYLFADSRDNDITDVFFVLALLLPPYVDGRISRRLAVQAELLLGQQELVRQTAIRDERDRIARDLHDVIAHSVSAMVVQTAAAQDLVRSDPGRAEAILADVADTGRRALAETGRLLHVIRDTADELGLEPAPGLAQVPDLVDRFRADGLEVDLRIDEPLPALDAGVDVSAYRIIQEALTNALRYAADSSVSLAVDSGPGRVSIRVANEVNGARSMGSGLGLLGMAERVAVLGGTLTHGEREAGRFELEAMLPVGG
jgi:signal transduction histidine kinase